MIRIVFVVDRIGGVEGGSETQLLMLLNGLNRNKFKPHLVYLRHSDFLAEDIHSFTTTYIPVGKFLSGELLRGIAAFRSLTRSQEFDIVQTVFWDSTVFGTIAARLSGCPVVISSRRSLGYWRTRKRTSLMRILRYGISHHITNSAPVKDEIVNLDGVPPEKVSVIPNGVNLVAFEQAGHSRRSETREEWGFGADNLVIGGISTLRPVKQVETLVRAAVQLLKEFPHIRFVWIGSGAVDKYRQLASSLQLEDRFVFPGPTRDVPRVLDALDIAVQCSASESLSNSLLEYMAAGLPIVASNVGGTSHAIIDGRTGMLYEPGRTSDLEGSLRRLILDPGLRSSLGTSARQAAQSSYSKEAMILRHEELYSRLAEVSRQGRPS